MVPVTKLPSHLPDLCLENIFKRVPLRDLIRSVRVVCTNWNRVVPIHLRVRRELVLVRDYNEDVEMIRKNKHRFENDLIEHVHREDGSPWVQLPPLDRIRLNALLLPSRVLTEGFTSPLLDTVPHITHLTVVQDDIASSSVISALVQLVRLLNHYRHRLISFKLDLSINSTDVDVDRAELVANCTSLLNSINQLEHLRHLTLSDFFESYSQTVLRHGLQLPRLSILSRLDTFTSNNMHYVATWLMDSIRLHATGRVRIDCTPRLSVEAINGLDQQLTSKLTSLIITNSLRITHYDNIRQLRARFISISRLALFVQSMPMTMLARCLSPLAQLVNLKIVYWKYITKDE